MTIETNEVTEGVMYTKTTAREASVQRKPTSEPNWRKPQGKISPLLNLNQDPSVNQMGKKGSLLLKDLFFKI